MLTNEEMEALNQASEILSKHAAIGGITKLDFDHFERMVIAIIDEYGKSENDNDNTYNDGNISSTMNESTKSLLIKKLCSLLSIALRIRKFFHVQELESKGKVQQQNESQINNRASLASSSPLPLQGTYSEKLSTGGELRISTNSWSIHYYFPGPDRRYNGTFVTLQGEKINLYISAWKENLKKYFELKQSVPHDGSFHAKGEMGMTIRIGGFWDGVSLISYHMRVQTEQQVENIVKDYEYAKARAAQLMKV